jgi:hypothetical protein
MRRAGMVNIRQCNGVNIPLLRLFQELPRRQHAIVEAEIRMAIEVHVVDYVVKPRISITS